MTKKAIKIKKSGFFETNYENFLNSFRNINKNIAFMAFYDLIFFGLSFLIVYLAYSLIQKKALEVNMPQNMLELSIVQAENLLGSIKGFYYLLIIAPILIVLLLIVLWSFFKGINWCIAAKRKFTFRFFLRFLLLNLAWLIFWILIVFLISISIQQNLIAIYILIVLLISVYLSNIIYAVFVKNDSFASIKKGIKIAFTKIHYFLLPSIAMLVILYIISLILLLFKEIPENISIVVTLLMLAVYLAWSRLYIVEVVNSIEKTH